MKNLLLIFLTVFTFDVLAQECTPWFPFKEGSKFEYTFFDKKDRPTSRMLYEVTDMKAVGAGYEYMLKTIMYDKKDKELNGFEFSVTCADGTYQANISNFANPQLKEVLGSMEVKVTGDDLTIPKSLSVGQELPDANSTSEAKMGIVNMKLEMRITDRKVISKEKVTTPLKTFDSYKITSINHIKMPMLNRSSQSVSYYAEGYGHVKSETMDKKGKLDSYMLLTKFEK